MVLTLQGKLGVAMGSLNLAPAAVATAPTQVQIQSALVNLGFRPVDVEKVVRGLGELAFEDGVRQGLAALSQVSK
jgi:Holliday junction resolvasome RuvABC DNA-binding subunit